MACQTVLEHLTDLCDGVGPEALRAHVVTCKYCRTLLSDQLTLRRALSDLPTIPLPSDFQQELLSRLSRLAEEPTPRPRTWRLGSTTGNWALALAALLLIVGGAWLALRTPPALDMSLMQLVSVDVEVQASTLARDVAFDIALPDGLQLASTDPDLVDLQHLKWTSDLTPGLNRFNLVLRAVSKGEQRVHVNIVSGEHTAGTELRVLVHDEHARLGLHLGSGGVTMSAMRLHLDQGGPS